jgi:hypothetical protein
VTQKRKTAKRNSEQQPKGSRLDHQVTKRKSSSGEPWPKSMKMVRFPMSARFVTILDRIIFFSSREVRFSVQ